MFSSPSIDTYTAPEFVHQIPTPESSIPLYALIIGINDYAHPKIYNLNGATADADAVSSFLTQSISIPSSNITNLRNGQATRTAIIEAIRAFSSDVRIKQGDPILIYYAGHGGEAPAPEGWDAGGPNAQIQMLIPHDFVPETTQTESGQGILDKEFNLLLSYVATTKGDNITVILDCCHSGSGTRGDDSTILVRGLDLPEGYSIYPNISQTVPYGARGTDIPLGFARTGLASHVLLAACREDQTAKETRDGGMFTVALLDVFNTVGINNVTYEGVIRRLQDLGIDQNPQCEGIHRSRVLFDCNSTSPRENVLYPVRRGNGNDYILDAGEAHGINNGSEFLVYAHRTVYPDTDQSLGTLIAYKTEGFTTRMRLADDSQLLEPSEQLFALQFRSGNEPDLRLCTSNEDVRQILIRIQATLKRRSVVLVKEEDNPDLVLALEDGEVVFNVSREISRISNMTRMPYLVHLDFDTMCRIITYAAHFYSSLSRMRKTGGLSRKVELQCLALKPQRMTEELFPILAPTGENLNKGGVIEIYVDDEQIYGFKVTNSSILALFVSLFYFDVSDLSITSYYQPAVGSGYKTGAIQPNAYLTIGYGAGDIRPREFYLRPDQEVDVGFVKIFITTTPVDYSIIPQDSPFDETRHGGIVRERSKLIPAWDTIQVPIIQRKRRSTTPLT